MAILGGQDVPLDQGQYGMTPLPNQYAGQNPLASVAPALGMDQNQLASMVASQFTNPFALQGQLGGMFNTNMNNLMSQIAPMMGNIRGTTAAAQGNVGSQSGTVSNDIMQRLMSQFAPMAFSQASNEVSGQEAFQRALAQRLYDVASQRDPYTQTGKLATGLTGSGKSGVNPYGNLDPSGMFGGIKDSAQQGPSKPGQNTSQTPSQQINQTKSPDDETPPDYTSFYDSSGMTPAQVNSINADWASQVGVQPTASSPGSSTLQTVTPTGQSYGGGTSGFGQQGPLSDPTQSGASDPSSFWGNTSNWSNQSLYGGGDE